jgi:hypothetical protein
MYLMSCAWVGFALLSALFSKFALKSDPLNGHLWLFFSMAGGISLHIAVLFFLGLSGQLDALSISVSSGVILLLSSVVIFKRTAINALWLQLKNNKFNALLHLLVLMGIFALVTSFALQAPGNWDDTSYHLPYAQYYLDHKSLQMDEYLRFPLFPNHMDLLFAFGLLYGGVFMAQAMATLPIVVIAIGLIGATRRFLGSSMAGLLAFGLFFYLGPVQESLGYAYIDNGLALFCWAALLALMLMGKDEDNRAWIILALLMAGTAADVKLFGVVWTALLCIYVALSTKSWRTVIWFGLGSALVGSWWYFRSYWISGDPIHPMGGPLFGYYLWNAQDLMSQSSEQATHGSVKSIYFIWTALTDAKITWIVPVFFAPLFFRRIDRPIAIAYLVFIGYFLFWFYVTQVARYLAPALVIASFLTFYVWYRFGGNNLMRRWRVRCSALRWSFVSPLAMLVLVGLFLNPTYIDAVQRMQDWKQTLAARKGYDLYQHANSLDEKFGHRLIQLGFENGVYFYHGVAIGDWFGAGRYTQFLDCSAKCVLLAPEQMLRQMAVHHSQILMISSQRYTVDLASYSQYFDLRYTAQDGYLLTPKAVP